MMKRIFLENKNEDEKLIQISFAFALAKEILIEDDTKIILYSNSKENLKSFKNKELEFFSRNDIQSCQYKEPIIIAIDVNFKSIEKIEEMKPDYKSLIVIPYYSQIEEFKTNWIDVWETIVIDSEGNYNNSSQITISDEIVKNVVEQLSEVNIYHNNDIGRVKSLFKRLKDESRIVNSHEIFCYLIREKGWTYKNANEFKNLIKKI